MDASISSMNYGRRESDPGTEQGLVNDVTLGWKEIEVAEVAILLPSSCSTHRSPRRPRLCPNEIVEQEVLERFEWEQLTAALESTRGNHTGKRKVLGHEPAEVRKKCRTVGINRGRFSGIRLSRS